MCLCVCGRVLPRGQMTVLLCCTVHILLHLAADRKMAKLQHNMCQDVTMKSDYKRWLIVFFSKCLLGIKINCNLAVCQCNAFTACMK